jgi:hypothetical protein
MKRQRSKSDLQSASKGNLSPLLALQADVCFIRAEYRCATYHGITSETGTDSLRR